MRSTEQKVLRWEARAVLSMSPCERARARWGWPRTATVARAGSSRRRQAAPVASGRRGLLGPCLGRARPPGLQRARPASSTPAARPHSAPAPHRLRAGPGRLAFCSRKVQMTSALREAEAVRGRQA